MSQQVREITLNGHHNPQLPSLQLVQTSRAARRAAKFLTAGLIVTVIGVVFVPWQQTVTGSGRVVAYDPLQRQQVVKAQIEGRIKSWGEAFRGEEIREGVFVKKGETVLELQDNDPLLRQRLQMNVELASEKIKQTKEKIKQYEGYVQSFVDARTSTIESAKELIASAENELVAKERDLDAAEAAEDQKRKQAEREKNLFETKIEGARVGLTSKYKLEVAQREHAEAVQKVEAAKAYVKSAEAKVRAKTADRDKKDREAAAKVSGAEADLRTARADLTTYEKERQDAESKLAKLDQGLTVPAPADGYVLSLAAFRDGDYVKKGDALFTLVPEPTELAVEVWVSGNDVPLVKTGRHVRLQFEGWPAVQFSGWPSVAVGTFGGTVKTVDSTDNGAGRFRVLVLPDEESPSWPDAPYLRQGARANSWVLLDQVPLGYEIWRRLNGFPPAVAMDKGKPGGEDKKKKPEKPPKPRT